MAETDTEAGEVQDRTKEESQMIGEPKVEVRTEQPYVAIPIKVKFYLTDPAEQPDLEKWSIELAYLVRGDSAEK